MIVPRARDVVELLKPLTWFAPMWAFACGVVSAGVDVMSNLGVLAAGVVLSGPLLCASSQAVNDWQDRHVDAINQPERPIPSGRISPAWGGAIAILWTLMSLVLAAFLGLWVWMAAAIGLVLSWAYSTPPVRLKSNGWWGNAAVAVSYEGLAWFAGAAVMIGGFPGSAIVWLAVLYSVGAHGIMTLNDFKSVVGDRETGVKSLPAQLGVDQAARLACLVMALPQVVVVGLLWVWDRPGYALAVLALLVVQGGLMLRFLKRPRELAPWYNATGTTLYVLGMMISAWAVRQL